MQVLIPKWENRVQLSMRTKTKYWLAKDFNKLPKKHLENINLQNKFKLIKGILYLIDKNGDRFIKNSKKAGTPKFWRINGQDLYNAVLNYIIRAKVADYYHNYFSKYIKEQLQPINFTEDMIDNYGLSISCDIYEIKQFPIPDVSNMWLLEKFFEDSLVNCGIIPDDNPNYVIESGRKRYFWVSNPEERKLIFYITLIKLQNA
jgi:hypothetical protein